ncbi:MAG TPA: ATP-binding protein, partial [Anaerohalosphaeraceae bacterium]|nr:ATP-binding protein [Anaerohalosphaeraceae bacterium]
MERKITKFDDKTIQEIFGHEAAENENKQRLKEYYFKSKTFERITADLPLRILVGHKGIGKSALFMIAMQEDEDDGVLSILIRPDDVQGIETKGNDILQSIRSWKDGLLDILYNKVIDSLHLEGAPAFKTYLGKVGRMTNFITEVLAPVITQYVNVEVCRKKVVSEFAQRKKINIYIDDLDRGWRGDRDSIARLSALLNALRDLSTENDGLNFKVALRSDVYYLVRTSDESTDKIEGAVVWHSWTNHEILAMLIKRVESFFGFPKDEIQLMKMKQRDMACLLNSIMEPIFRGCGKWENVPIYRILMSLIRKRPRDLIKLCSLAANHAAIEGRMLIVTADWESIFSEYSQGRLQDTINEFRSELPEIKKLLFGMKPNKREKQTKQEYVYTTDSLFKKIKNIEQQGSFLFYDGRKAGVR